jgi:multidrug resistance efflux pump
MIEQENQNINLKSDEVQEILGTPPVWMVRWGTTLIFVIMILIFWIGYLLKYPNIITSRITLTTNIPPSSVIARTTGYLSKVMTSEGQSVSQGDLLAVIQSAANYEDVIRLDSVIINMDGFDKSKIDKFNETSIYQLGDLQPYYSTLIQYYKEYKFDSRSGFATEDVSQFNSQIRNYKRMIQVEEEKKSNAESNLTMAQNRFNEKKRLYSEPNSNISRYELEDARRDILKYEQAKKDYQSNVINYESDITRIGKSINDVKQNNQIGSNDKLIKVIESFNQLKSAIDKWKLNYLIKAPSQGKVTFLNKVWTDKQNVKEGEEILAIVPANKELIVGRLLTTSYGSGQILTGQVVNIKFDSYPYEQFGIVKGAIKSKALVPNNDSYISVEVILPQDLKTSYGQKLKFEQQMQGTAEIITQDRRLISRIFDKFISVFKNR